MLMVFLYLVEHGNNLFEDQKPSVLEVALTDERYDKERKDVLGQKRTGPRKSKSKILVFCVCFYYTLLPDDDVI